MNIRQATIEDAGHFVRVFELASHGLAPYYWQKTADPDGDPQVVARKSMISKLTKAAPNTVLVAEMDGRVAGGIITYDIGEEPEEIPSDCDPAIATLIELENLALNTRYVNAVAVFPEAQGQGIGSALLSRAAENAGPEGMSLIIEDLNVKARKLYERMGYKACHSAPIESPGWETDAKSFILMVREAN